MAAVDGGFTAESAANYAILLAKQCRADLFVVFVITKDLSEKEIATGRLSVDRVVDRAVSEGVDAGGIVEYGRVVRTVRSIAEANNIDLVVSSTRHEDSKRRYFVRSISQRLMRSLSCSSIVVRAAHPGKTLHIEKLLVPVITGAYHAAERAYLISKLASGARVTALRVEKISRTGLLLMGLGEKLNLRNSGKDKLRPLAEELSKYDIPADIDVDLAPGFETSILKKALSGRFDLVLMGATKKDILRQVVQGNPVEKILRKTPCDVIIWYPGTASKSEREK